MPNKSAKSPARLLKLAAISRARKGSRAWMLVGLVLYSAPVLRRAFGRPPEALTIERLAPGEAVRVDSVRRPTRRQRRATRRAARRTT